MDLSIFLAQLLGAYFVIAGGVVLFRRKSLIPVVAEFGHDRALILVIALMQLLGGLAIAISHSIWTPDWQGLITLIGWWMIVESVLYLTMPYTGIRRWIRMFNTNQWYVAGGFLSIAIGLYLAGIGFGYL
ncbi:hypothetical protein C4585_03215 [Candidatus Parcubacteria bacterium]|nr:MAG: hypothetical protein C4585_03215 [Candidatus Parcubacteria bacterium]